jgi:uncharacterized coiled-coil protein SlyX
MLSKMGEIDADYRERIEALEAKIALQDATLAAAERCQSSLGRLVVHAEYERDEMARKLRRAEKELERLKTCEQCNCTNEVTLCEDCADEQARNDAADAAERTAFFGGAR